MVRVPLFFYFLNIFQDCIQPFWPRDALLSGTQDKIEKTSLQSLKTAGIIEKVGEFSLGHPFPVRSPSFSHFFSIWPITHILCFPKVAMLYLAAFRPMFRYPWLDSQKTTRIESTR